MLTILSLANIENALKDVAECDGCKVQVDVEKEGITLYISNMKMMPFAEPPGTTEKQAEKLLDMYQDYLGNRVSMALANAGIDATLFDGDGFSSQFFEIKKIPE